MGHMVGNSHMVESSNGCAPRVPAFSMVKTLLHFDGTDASTTFTDSGSNPKTWTAVNQAQLDTAQFKYGTASLLLDGTDDEVTTPNHADWAFGAGDFTVECWARLNADSGFNYMFGSWGTGGNRAWILYPPDSTSAYFGFTTDGSTEIIVSATASISLGTWYHFAAVRYGNNITTYFNGVGGTPYNIGTTALFTPTSVLRVGRNPDVGAESSDFNGWIDDLRITKGFACYICNFTPPTGPHADS